MTTIPLTALIILAAIAGFECGYILASYIDARFRAEKLRTKAAL
jgi:hypothetical protein